MIEGIVALFFANFIGGALGPLFLKIGIHEFPVLTFTTLRFLIATVVFLPFFLKGKGHFNKKQTKQLVFYSLLFSINTILYGIGLQFTSALVSQILYATVPIFTGIFSYFLIHEKFGVNKIIGALIAMSGVGILVYSSVQKHDTLSLGTPLGNGIILISVLSWSLYLIFSKRLTAVYSPSTTSFASFFITFVFASILMPFEWIIRPFSVSTITPIGLSSLLGIGIFSTTLSFFLIQYGVKKTSPFTASLFLYLAPLFSAVTAIPFLHEKITIELILGGFLIITGVFFATTYEYLKKKH